MRRLSMRSITVVTVAAALPSPELVSMGRLSRRGRVNTSNFNQTKGMEPGMQAGLPHLRAREYLGVRGWKRAPRGVFRFLLKAESAGKRKQVALSSTISTTNLF